LFAQTLGEAERLLAVQARPYSAAYAKALALAGLALCRDAGLAAAAYRDARAISAAPGAVADALQDLDALAAADHARLLQPVRRPRRRSVIDRRRFDAAPARADT
jgi:hypothetical protein